MVAGAGFEPFRANFVCLHSYGAQNRRSLLLVAADFDRCANKRSLHPPPAAVACVAPGTRRSSVQKSTPNEKKLGAPKGVPSLFELWVQFRCHFYARGKTAKKKSLNYAFACRDSRLGSLNLMTRMNVPENRRFLLFYYNSFININKLEVSKNSNGSVLIFLNPKES